MKWPTNENEILNSEETHEPYFGDKSSDSNIEVINNHIYFYSEIKRNSILKLNKKLKELETKLLTYADSLNWEPPGIYLHINSYGGSVFAGVAAMDQILSCKIPVYTVIDKRHVRSYSFLWSSCYNPRGLVPHLCIGFLAIVKIIIITRSV